MVSQNGMIGRIFKHFVYEKLLISIHGCQIERNDVSLENVSKEKCQVETKESDIYAQEMTSVEGVHQAMKEQRMKYYFRGFFAVQI
jgi:hypothetical protein